MKTVLQILRLCRDYWDCVANINTD